MNTDRKPDMMTDVPDGHHHSLYEEVEQLRRDLDESRKATEAIQRLWSEEVAKEKAGRAQLGADYLELSARHGRTLQSLASANAVYVRLHRALHILFLAFTDAAVMVHQAQWPGEIFRAIEDANDVLQELGIPF